MCAYVIKEFGVGANNGDNGESINIMPFLGGNCAKKRIDSNNVSSASDIVVVAVFARCHSAEDSPSSAPF